MTTSSSQSSAADLLTELRRYIAFTSSPFDKGQNTPSVFHMRGREKLSQPFNYDVCLVTSQGCKDFASIVGQSATVEVKWSDDRSRCFNGVIESFRYDGVGGQRLQTYTATIVPRFSLTKQRINSRIFMDKKSIDIVSTILREHSGLIFDIRLSHSADLPKRDFCVQYNESDFDFISRLLEQDGIYYYFEHAKNHHVMVLVDDWARHELCPVPAVITNPTANRFMFNHPGLFWEWNETTSLQRHIVVVDDHNHETPGTNLRCTEPVPDVQIGDIPIASEGQMVPSGEQRGTTKPGPHAAERNSYEYPARHVDPQGAAFYARIKAQEAGCRAYRAHIVGSVTRLAVGYRFFADNPHGESKITVPPLQQQWLVLSSEFVISGDRHDLTTKSLPGIFDPDRVEAPLLYRSVIEAAPALNQFRPPLVTPRPFIRGPQTAIVAGREGEVVLTDDLDRIKVKFFWDRDDAVAEENRSCWIRVAQPLAGAGYGAVVLPRRGQEVVVSFIDGNPDWPLVTGVVYNKALTPPERVTPRAAQSVFRTQTVGCKGEKYNELRFDDTAGAEEMFQRAERDWRLLTKEDCDLRVGHRLAAVVTAAGTPGGPSSWIEATADAVSLHTTLAAGDPEAPSSWIELRPGMISLVVRSVPGEDQVIQLTPAGIALIGATIGLTAFPPAPELPQITAFPMIPLVGVQAAATEAKAQVSATLPVTPNQNKGSFLTRSQ